VAVPSVAVRNLWRRFDRRVALCDVSLEVRQGEICALLGPNGAGKTTLLRILSGLTLPTQGTVSVMGHDPSADHRAVRGIVGLVPGGDRSFYLRISGLENLIFFARLYGMSRREAASRTRDLLRRVDLLDAAHLPVGKYSHGMQKRLAIARALLTSPAVLLMDEATHDLDPEGGQRVRDLVREAAAEGTAVLWTTQHLDEIRGFAHTATVLNAGRVRFTGTVPELLALAPAATYLLQIRHGAEGREAQTATLNRVLGSLGVVAPEPSGTPEHWVLALADGTPLGAAIAALVNARFEVLACRDARPEIEAAFLQLTGPVAGRAPREMEPR